MARRHGSMVVGFFLVLGVSACGGGGGSSKLPQVPALTTSSLVQAAGATPAPGTSAPAPNRAVVPTPAPPAGPPQPIAVMPPPPPPIAVVPPPPPAPAPQGGFYAPTSPWNQSLPSAPRLTADSDSVMNFVWSQGSGYMSGARLGYNDYGFPFYTNAPTDPQMKLHCYEPWGTCPFEGKLLRIPANAARAEGCCDHHLTIIDAATNDEYDFYEAPGTSAIVDGGTFTVGFGALMNLKTGSGFGGGVSVAAGASSLGGVVTLAEFASGRISHALAMAAYCSTSGSVFPATATATQPCDTNGPTPPLGARFWLDSSAADIDALNVSRPAKMVLKALHDYGAFMTDTNGKSASMDIRNVPESPTSNPAVLTWAAANLPALSWAANNYMLDLYTLPKSFWTTHLHVVDPCVTKQSC